VYGNQLKRRSEEQVKESLGPNQEPIDLVNISINARQKELLSRMPAQIIYEMNSKENLVKKEATDPLESLGREIKR
jgi:hypothetical protein